MKKQLILICALTSAAIFGAANDTFDSRLSLYRQAVAQGNFESIFERHRELAQFDKVRACEISRNDEALLDLIVTQKPAADSRFLGLFAHAGRVHAYDTAIRRENWKFFSGILEQKQAAREQASQSAQREQAAQQAAETKAREELETAQKNDAAKNELLSLMSAYSCAENRDEKNAANEAVLEKTQKLYLQLGKTAYHAFAQEEAFAIFAQQLIEDQNTEALEKLAMELDPESDICDTITKALYRIRDARIADASGQDVVANQAALEGSGPENEQSTDSDEENDELQVALAVSRAEQPEPAVPSAPPVPIAGDEHNLDQENDEEIAAAIAASLTDQQNNRLDDATNRLLAVAQQPIEDDPAFQAYQRNVSDSVPRWERGLRIAAAVTVAVATVATGIWYLWKKCSR